MCVVNDGRIVHTAFGNSAAWPAAADDRADKVINNGSAYDLVVYQYRSAHPDFAGGWALCIPQGRVADLGSTKPAVQNQASSHRWMPANHCGGKVTWLPTTNGNGAPERSVNVARSQLGVREVPPNNGIRVSEYQRSVLNDDYALGQAWCASFITWVGLQANDPTPFRSALVSEWVQQAQAGRKGMSVVRSSDVRVGDLVAFKKAGKWEHMGIVSSVTGGVMVISANTTAPDNRAEGVFDKPLTRWTGTGFAATFLRNAA